MTTATKSYDYYTVGGWSTSGREVSGGSHRTLEQARIALDHFAALPGIASMTVYGWDETTGDVDELTGFCR